MNTKPALVVDDNAANRDFLERLMISAGFNVTSASTGKEALAYAESQPELLLALIDMELPDMNGIQLTAALRACHPKAYLVVATMHDEYSIIEGVMRKGANVFLVKPHGFMELYRRLTTTDFKALHEQGAMVIDQYGVRPFSTATT